MCGLAGIISQTPVKANNPALRGMMAALAHRGPDDEGVFAQGHVAIGHKRLSIVDLESGRQPIKSANGNVVAVNGMIYNYLEIKAQFPDFGYQTRSDSEIPLVLYEHYGEKFAERLRGMYALALYDTAKDILILARDSYGIKPLYYAQCEAGFVFASEPQAMFAAGLLEPEVEEAKSTELLQLKFVTSRQTVFQGVQRVLPGETLVIQGGDIIRRFRQDVFKSKPVQKTGHISAMAELDRLMQETLQDYVISDVPYGVFLSGGVDSCAIVAAMAKIGQRGYPCYTASFPSSRLHDESTTAANIAKAAGADHVNVTMQEEDFWAELPELISRLDDPSLDPAMIANFILAKRAAKDVKVILGGDGGDEIFGGYRRYERTLLPKFIPERPMRAKGLFAGTGLLKLDNQDWRDGYAASVQEARAKTASRLQALQATDGADFLPHFHLMKLDRCLMAHGIEGRVPLLDQRLAEFAYNLPAKLKLKRGKGKLLLRQWLDANMPEAEAFSRKRGFSTPVNDWIAKRAPDFEEFVSNQRGVEQQFNVDRVRKLFQEPAGKPRKYLWSIFFYALWHERHIIGHEFADMEDLAA